MHTMTLDCAASDQLKALVVEVGSIINALDTSFTELQYIDVPPPADLLH